jgi:transglutaminase-like putative cysteine protease
VRFAQVHKVAAYVLAVLGLVALGAGGELQGASAALLAAGVLASWFAEGELLQSERYHRAWNVAVVLAFFAQLGRALFLDAPLLTATVEFAAFLQLLKLATRRTARDYQQVTVLALLHLIAATVLGGGLSYALCFLGFVIATPWAMTLGHLRREIEGNYLADARAGRAGVPIDVARILRSRRVVSAGLLVGSSLLSVPIFALTAMVFVLFPRIGIGVLSLRQQRGQVVSGLGSTVDLQGHGVIRNDPTIVLRVEPLVQPANPPLLRAFRLRGSTFDHYDGRRWTRTAYPGQDNIPVERIGDRYALTRFPSTDTDTALRLVLDPLEPPVVLLPEGTAGLLIEPRLERGMPRYMTLTVDTDDRVHYANNDEVGLVYTAFSPPPGALPARHRRPNAEQLQRYTQVPQDLSPEVRALAQRVTAGARGPLEKARAVERFLGTFRYTLRLESGGAQRPLEDFLFRSHAGHCEYFSTAMAVLLRTVDVPTRNVTGFLGGTYNRYGRFYAIHQGDAHSWVEVYDPHGGWVTFDPTPPAGEVPVLHTGFFSEVDAVVEALRLRWRTYVVGFDLSTQTRLAVRLWRFFEARRGHTDLNHAARGLQRARTRLTDAPRRVPWRELAFGALLLGAGAFALRRYLRDRTAPPGQELPPSARAARQLALALDAAFARRGHQRPASQSPSRFALEIARGADPAGPVAVRVAERYTEARFGDRPLAPGELDALLRELSQLPEITKETVVSRESVPGQPL